MKNRIIYMLLVFVGGLFVSSCSVDELEQVNPNESTTDSFWETQDQCQQGINAIYNAFKDRDLMGMRIENQHSDMAHKYQQDPNNPFYLKNYNNSQNDIQKKWSALYTGIFRANQALEGLMKFKTEHPGFDEAKWNDWYAQALFFRGLFHFYLYSSFNEGEIPIRSKVPASTADYNVPVSSAQDVFDFFMTDLKAAYVEGMLPDSWKAGEEGKITRGAVAAVIGQAYLYEANYDSAKVYFEDVINNASYGYALTADPKDNVTTHAELNSESILEIVYSYALKPEENANSTQGVSSKYVDEVSPVEAQYGGAMFPSYWLQMAYKTDSMDTTDPRNMAPVIDLITSAPTGEIALRKYNLRASAYVAFVDDEASNYYLSRPVFAYAFNNGQSACFKMMSNCNEFDYNNLPNEETYKSGVNFRVIRLADVYLMYAECLVEGGTNDGGVADALAYINKVRYRSALLLCGLPGGEYAASDFDDKIYTAEDVMHQLMYVERPLEISILGHATRHIDLRRWKIYKERFEELAAKRYAFGSYPVEKWSDVDVNGEMKRKYLYPNANEQFVDPITGKKVIRYGAIIYDESYLDNAVAWNLAPAPSSSFRTEYGESAANYVESEHGYWPIPLVEETTNPGIYAK